MLSISFVAPLISEHHVFENPAKLIKTIEDMKIWEKSEAYFEYLGFILAINEAVKGKSNSRGSEDCSDEVLKVVALLDKLDEQIDQTPPVQQPQRFGNIAFRSWYQQLKDNSLVLLQDVLPPKMFKAIPEIVSYLIEGFGNSTRIDYGTGHEISFIMFLCCLFKVGLLKSTDKVATGCTIFPKYLDVARKLQITYRMEPAGSHGVWSLDDYQFVPFIWGSSQLFAHPSIQPASFMEPKVLDQFADDYMFLTCIRYINQVKTGPFAEHSNQLWSISGVSSWSKINGGLIKMYKAEVLSKFPVVQHIVFGTLFTLKAVEQSTGLMATKTSMTAPPRPYSKSGEMTAVRKDSSTRSLTRDSSDSKEGSSESRDSVPSKGTTSSSEMSKSSHHSNLVRDGLSTSIVSGRSGRSGVPSETGRASIPISSIKSPSGQSLEKESLNMSIHSTDKASANEEDNRSVNFPPEEHISVHKESTVEEDNRSVKFPPEENMSIHSTTKALAHEEDNRSDTRSVRLPPEEARDSIVSLEQRPKKSSTGKSVQILGEH